MKISDNSTDRVLLITLVGTTNYGNRLQHYALKTIIEREGFSVTSLKIRHDPDYSLKLRAQFAVMALLRYNKRYAQFKRTQKLIAFNQQHIGKMLFMPVDQVYKSNWNSFRYAVAGSDQVWHNWHWKEFQEQEELSFYYLNFMPVEKRLCYAPSFGFKEYSDEDKEIHWRGLQGMTMLSCREKEGCDLIFQLTGRKAEKVLDPTLLLTAEEWSRLEKRPRCKIPKHFMIQFYWGDVTEEYQNELNRISEKNKLQIINLQDMNNPPYYGLSPFEFIWMIHHADIICTDSFHASIFAIMFERNLRVFARKGKHSSMFGRLHDLLEPLGLMNNIFGVGEELSTKLSHDARRRLETERELSLNYLRNSLGKNG